MPRYTVILGDDLPALQHLSTRTDVIDGGGEHSDPPSRSARAVVIGLDLRAATTLRDAKRHLKDVLHYALEDVRRYPALVHLCIMYLAPEAITADRLSSVAGSVASRLHAALERTTGQYVAVTLLDVTECRDHALLADRILERVAEGASVNTDIALEWSDIRGRSITQATLDYYA